MNHAEVESYFKPFSAESARKLHSSAATDTQTDRSAAHKTTRTLRLWKVIVNQFFEIWNI